MTTLALPWSRPIGHGAATPVLFAANPRVEGASGHYDEDCAEAKRISECDTHSGRVAPYAPDRRCRASSRHPYQSDAIRAERPGLPGHRVTVGAARGSSTTSRSTPTACRGRICRSAVSAVATSGEAAGHLPLALAGVKVTNTACSVPPPSYGSPCGDALALRDGLRSCRDALAVLRLVGDRHLGLRRVAIGVDIGDFNVVTVDRSNRADHQERLVRARGAGEPAAAGFGCGHLPSPTGGFNCTARPWPGHRGAGRVWQSLSRSCR